ncbi:type III-A CRISPR-associated protein Cas10/Csm1, partial [Desulfurobacterium sp.]|uniref:type III-A CRISPR-associated protein Cas10/Csm1 n=1 Tax=Desulfurobacterium sp. TaxID=2004706 RepID=UPI00263069F5
FDSLYRIYASHVPSARVGKVIPDVSLYDHSRTTAVFAAALYLYHIENSFEEKAIKDRTASKFLLISGDFYGIQKFIFRAGGEERHHRAKLLRGRSFQVSLLTDLAAEFICEKLDLTFLSIVLSAAGKFHIIAPNTNKAKEALKEVKEELISWFYKNFHGEAGIGIVYTEASPLQFLNGNFHNLWQYHLKRLEEAKYNRIDIVKYSGKVNGYLDSFDNTLSKPLCPLCGKAPSYLEVKDEEEYCACKLCYDQAYIGTQLVRGKKLAVVKGTGELKEPLFNKYQIVFLEEENLEEHAELLAKKGSLVKLVEFNINDDGSCPTKTEFLPINGYVPVYDSDDIKDIRIPENEIPKISIPKMFNHIAQKSLKLKQDTNNKVSCYGVPLLASMKADVDNLGAIFACGLPKELFTLSRLATMSRQLNNFFTLYLPYALKKERKGAFKEIYTVFAGGDDLFLIGPWNAIMDLALHIHEKFTLYICENPQMHLSAGIALHKPHTPVDRIAQESEELLKMAKSEGRNRICIFHQAPTWKEFEELNKIKETLYKWYSEGKLSRSLLYKINTLCEMASEEGRFHSNNCIPIAKLHYAKWPALLRYYLVRNILKENTSEEYYREIATNLFVWINKYRSKFVVALWPMLYEMRKQKVLKEEKDGSY